MAGTCTDCGVPLAPAKHARGLCKTCYDRNHKRGTHLDHPTKYRTRADVVEDYLLLRGRGVTREEIAARMRMNVDALHQALKRAALAGDDRIDYRPQQRQAAA